MARRKKYKEIAKAYVSLVPRAAQNSQQLIKKELEPAVDKAATSAGVTGGDAINTGILSKIKDIAIGNILANAVTSSATMVGNAVRDVFKGAIDSYANYEQMVGGTKKIFGDAADQVIGWADDAYKSSQMSANKYMDTITSFSSSLISSLGGDTQEAARLANTALADISDNYATFGGNFDSISMVYSSLARGSFAMVDNLKLGYGGSMREMARMINDSGVLGEQKIDLDQKNIQLAIQDVGGYATMLKAIHETQVRLGISGLTAAEAEEAVANGLMTEEEAFNALGTTAKESATTIEGSMAAAKAMYENWLTALARDDVDIGSVTNTMIEAFVTAADNIGPRFVLIMQRLGEALQENLPIISKYIQEYLPGMAEQIMPAALKLLTLILTLVIENLPGMISDLTDVVLTALEDAGKKLAEDYPEFAWFFNNLVDIIKIAIGAFLTLKATMMVTSAFQTVIGLFTSLRTATTAATGAQDGLNVAMKANPILSIVSLITSLIGALMVLYGTNEDFKNLVDSVWGAFCKWISDVFFAFVDFSDGVGNWFSDIGKAIDDFFWGIVYWMVDVYMWFQDLPNKIDEAFRTLVYIITFPFEHAYDIIAGVIADIGHVCEDIFNWFVDLPNKIGDAFERLADIISWPFKQAFAWIVDLWNSTLGGFDFDIPEWVPFVGGQKIQFEKMEMPAMAEGGIIAKPTTVYAGEHGTEAIIPFTSQRAMSYLSEAGFNNDKLDLDGIGEIVAEAVSGSLSGLYIEMDGVKVAKTNRKNVDRVSGSAGTFRRRGLAGV